MYEKMTFYGATKFGGLAIFSSFSPVKMVKWRKTKNAIKSFPHSKMLVLWKTQILFHAKRLNYSVSRDFVRKSPHYPHFKMWKTTNSTFLGNFHKMGKKW